MLLLGTLPTVVRWLTDVRALLARGLLTNQTAALRARAQQLAAARRAAVAAEAQTLRRLERDIHDGPQQRLVRLGMDLEAATRRLDDDPDRVRPLLAEALAQSREALDELRALSRGIAPPILADRGLGPALAAAAARWPVEVSLDVALDDGRRLPGAGGEHGVLRGHRGADERRQARARVARDGHRHARAPTRCWSPCPTTASAARTRARATAWPGSPTGWRSSRAAWTLSSPHGRPDRAHRRDPAGRAGRDLRRHAMMTPWR